MSYPSFDLSEKQKAALRSALHGRLIALCFGSGVDSTAMMVALKLAGLKPDVITFADTGGEKPETIAHIERMNVVLDSWGWPLVDVCRKQTLPTTGYNSLYGNCLANETLPSLAFGMKSCSVKWKAGPQVSFLKGAKSGPNARPPHPLWNLAQATGQRIVKLIGYDSGPADMRRSKKFVATGEEDFDYFYPLQLIGWSRPDCVTAIAEVLGAEMVPVKSACYFCPASKVWELYWLAAEHPDLLEKALHLERVALTGRHSRFDSVEFGATWEELVKGADRFPSSNTTVGLGRSFAWNQWAWSNGVVDAKFKVKRSQKTVFAATAKALSGVDNALDSRKVPCAV